MQTNTSESLTRTIPELLENHTIQVQPQGYSMYPLFVPGRDSAVIEKADCDRLKKVMSFYTAGRTVYWFYTGSAVLQGTAFIRWEIIRPQWKDL